MAEKKYKWYKIAASRDELVNSPAGKILTLQVNSKNVCITVFNEKLFAFAAKCPHAGGYFADGYVDALGNVVCPLHRYKFSMSNGRNTSGEGYYLKTYPVEEREEGVFLGMETGWLF
jgi:nitrite reductase/ring-hydroxylating ferredoxin subunit